MLKLVLKQQKAAEILQDSERTQQSAHFTCHMQIGSNHTKYRKRPTKKHILAQLTHQIPLPMTQR